MTERAIELREATPDATPDLESPPADLGARSGHGGHTENGSANGEARLSATPGLESPPPELDGSLHSSDAHPNGASVNVHTLAAEAIRQAEDVAPATVAELTFSELSQEAVRELAYRGWSDLIRTVMKNMRRPGRGVSSSPGWDAVAAAHDSGKLDLARWSIDRTWVFARDLTIGQVTDLTDYYAHQEESHKTAKERFKTLRSAMKEKKAAVAGDLGDDKLMEILFGG